MASAWSLLDFEMCVEILVSFTMAKIHTIHESFDHQKFVDLTVQSLGPAAQTMKGQLHLAYCFRGVCVTCYWVNNAQMLL